MDEKRLVKAPPRVVRSTYEVLSGAGPRTGDFSELVIRVQTEGIRLRDLASYLWLVDRLYGRLDPAGLRSYAQRPREQLEVKHTRSGSVELVLSELVDLASPQNLALLWLILRGLPRAASSLAEAVHHYAGAFHDYQAGRLARIQRQQMERAVERDEAQLRAVRREMRAFLRDDERFADLPAERLAEIARVMARVYLADSDAVRNAHQFAVENVAAITFRIGDRAM